MINLLLLAVLAAVPSSADTVLRQRARSEGFRGMGAFESETTRAISGVKAREEGTFKFTGAILGRLSRKKPGAVEILRVDLDKRWSLDPKKKTYTETSITPKKGEKSEEEAEAPAPSGKDEKPTHRIKKTSFTVKKTDDTKDINGFDARRWAVEFVMEVEELATKEVSVFTMASDHWLTPWTKALRKAAAEEAAFNRAYLKKLGIALTDKDKAKLGLSAVMMLTRAAGPEVQRSLGDMNAKLAKLEGFAVRTESRWLSAPAKGAPKKKAVEEEAPEDDEPLDLGGGVGGLLGGFAKKAAKKKAAKMAEERATAQEGKPAFSSTTEVLSVSVELVDAAEFEVPAGFKLR